MDYNELNFQAYSAERQMDISVAFPVLMRKVYVWMTLALAITGFTAYAVATNAGISGFLFAHPQLIWVFFIAELALVIGLSAAIRKISLTLPATPT